MDNELKNMLIKIMEGQEALKLGQNSLEKEVKKIL